MTIESTPPVALSADASNDVPNATIIDDGTRVTAAWVEDDESDEFARTFESGNNAQTSAGHPAA